MIKELIQLDILLIGNPKAGKTSLLQRYIKGTFDDSAFLMKGYFTVM